MNDILSVAAWSTRKSAPVCRWRVELVDDFGRVIISLLQDGTEPANIVLSDDVENVWLISPSPELLIEHKIRPVQILDGPEGVRLEAMDTGGKGLVERPPYSSTDCSL